MTGRWKKEKSALEEVRKVRSKLDEARSTYEIALSRADNETASRYKYGVIPEYEKILKSHEEEMAKNKDALLREEVTADEIAQVVSRWSSVPVSKLLEGEREKLSRLSEILHERVIGQDKAVDAVSDAVIRSRAGIKNRNRPVGAFLFLGPTGVGKTELAKALAAQLFDDENAMVRLDMSEYMEKFAVSRLVGAPPGYVGFEEGGQLTEAVRRKQFSVVLLDEIEKAHPDVFNMLLQVMDDGRLTDSHGRTVSFKNTVLIMTSNAPKDTLRDYFRPEFLNRLDETLEFDSLDKEQIAKIVTLQIQDLQKRLADQNLTLKVSPSALELLSELGYDPQYGARPVKRAIQRELETPIARAIVEGRFAPGDEISATASNGAVKISK